MIYINITLLRIILQYLCIKWGQAESLRRTINPRVLSFSYCTSKPFNCLKIFNLYENLNA